MRSIAVGNLTFDTIVDKDGVSKFEVNKFKDCLNNIDEQKIP